MIKGIQKTTVIDYPDKIACTLFLGGCNFRCGFCYNSDIVLNPAKMDDIPEIEVLEMLKERKKFLDGVCITGGEPTIHPKLGNFLSKVKELGYDVKLDTNGTKPEVLRELIAGKLVDYIAMDVKAGLLSYDKVTQTIVDKEKIKESIDLIKQSGVDYEFRTTVVPDIIDEEEIESIGELVKGAKRFFLQQFRNDKNTLSARYSKKESISKERIEKFKEMMERYVDEVKIRNLK